MPQSSTLLFVHFIWATWNRTPVITPEWESPLYACIRKKCHELRCDSLAIGGIEDHVHILVRMHADVAVSQLAKQMKGASSHLMTHEIAPHCEFKWQGGYGALSESRTHVRRIQNYIFRQKEHHTSNKLWLTLETVNTD
jgi:REP element-mobilizing transposase RayT